MSGTHEESCSFPVNTSAEPEERHMVSQEIGAIMFVPLSNSASKDQRKASFLPQVKT